MTDVRSFTDPVHRIMNFRQGELKPLGPTTLAGEPDFVLGSLSISPSRLQVSVDNRREAIQPRVMQVLVTLARAKDTVVSRDELIRQCWGGRIVGEDAISRCVAKVRGLAELTAPSAFKIETVPRVGYRLEQTSAIDAVAKAAPEGEPLVAVLAFDNLSQDSDMAYFSDGLSEEILQTVAHGGALRVIGRGSSFQFRGAEKAASHVAKVLKATHVLDGSVRRSGSRLRISASLIECAGETTLWSQRFDHELVDVFALQDEIARAVADALRVVFEPASLRGDVSPEAFDLYLKALELRRGGLQDGRRLAVITLLRNAIALAPSFARAWEFLALMLATHLRFDDPASARVTAREEVTHAARTALEFNPKFGGAHQALAYLYPFAAFAEREALQRKAVSVTPNDPVVITNASFVYVETGRVLEGLDLLRKAYHLDPMNPWVANWYANVMDYAGLSGEARTFWDILHRQWPDNQLIAWNVIGIAAGHKDWEWFDALVEEAKAHHLDMDSLRPQITYGVALRSPNEDMRSRALRRAERRLSETGTLPITTFAFLYRLGLADDVFRLADQTSFAYMFDASLASPNGLIDEGLIFSELYNAEMMRDARFVSLCAKLGLCAYWVESNEWPDCADAAAPHYDFRAEARKFVQDSQANR